MFDNPKEDLQWLQDQLLAEEDAPVEAEEDWLDAELRAAHALMDNDYSRPARKEAGIFDYVPEEEDEVAVYADVPQEPPKAKKPKKEKGIGGLVFLACLETLGIIGVLLWWALWLL